MKSSILVTIISSIILTLALDFGCSTRLHEVGQKSTAKYSSLEGTLAYISPEQTGRMSRMIDYRTVRSNIKRIF